MHRCSNLCVNYEENEFEPRDHNCYFSHPNRPFRTFSLDTVAAVLRRNKIKPGKKNEKNCQNGKQKKKWFSKIELSCNFETLHANFEKNPC